MDKIDYKKVTDEEITKWIEGKKQIMKELGLWSADPELRLLFTLQLRNKDINCLVVTVDALAKECESKFMRAVKLEWKLKKANDRIAELESELGLVQDDCN